MKVYGPYLNREGRRIVLLYFDDGTKETTSYARWLIEQKLGRKLTKEETVDHIDRNKLNDNFENLKVRDRRYHISLDNKRVKGIEITCVLCGIKVYKKANQLKHNAKLGKAGPFCSKKCSGMYGQEIRFKKRKKLPVQEYIEKREYYYLLKES